MTLAPTVGMAIPQREHHCDEVQQMLYNASLWNGHRIHFDMAYATEVEGYAGLVVAGPLMGDWLHQVVDEWLGESGIIIGIEYSNRIAAFVGETVTAGGTVTALPKSVPGPVNVRVEAPLECLLTIFQGEDDGDAAFFSSELVIEGEMAPLVALHKGSWPELRKIVRQQVAWTHRHEGVLKSAEVMARVLWAVHEGEPLREAVERHGNDFFSARKASPWLHQEDAVVMDRDFSAACYIEHAFPVTLYLAWKYADDFEAGLMANTHLGGDNCHRGMVMGAIIGAAVGKNGIPGPWIQELKAHQALAELTERATGDAPMDHDRRSF